MPRREINLVSLHLDVKGMLEYFDGALILSRSVRMPWPDTGDIVDW